MKKIDFFPLVPHKLDFARFFLTALLKIFSLPGVGIRLHGFDITPSYLNTSFVWLLTNNFLFFYHECASLID